MPAASRSRAAPLDKLLTPIRIVAEGEPLLAPSVTRRLIAHVSHRQPRPGEQRRDFGTAPSSWSSPMKQGSSERQRQAGARALRLRKNSRWTGLIECHGFR